MSNTYTIRNSVGTVVATIKELQRNKTATNLVLHGRGSKLYGFERNQNLLYMLEHFASGTAPSTPIDGQLWWDDANKGVFVWNTSGSPEEWTSIVPTSQGLGFNVIAGDGLVGGGVPTGSPLTTTLDAVAGTGITIVANSISTNDSEIIHDNLSGFVANEHIDHSAVSLIAGAGLVGGGTLESNRSLNFVGTTGITTSGTDVVVDSSVVRTTGNQTISGIKTWTNQIRALDGSAGAPGYTFTGDLDSGMYLSGVSELSFTTGANQRFKMMADGVLRATTATYENLVTEDDDIPNKAYVDAQAGAIGSTPTSNTHVGVSSVSGLTIGKKYLIHTWGVTRNNGTGSGVLGGIRLTQGTTPGSGTLIWHGPQVSINWFDGNAPQSQTVGPVVAPSTSIAGTVDYRNNPPNPVEFRSAQYMVAVQLD